MYVGVVCIDKIHPSMKFSQSGYKYMFNRVFEKRVELVLFIIPFLGFTGGDKKRFGFLT